MIIKASQRGGANKLAAHLLNEQDNEHVEVHRVKGFLSTSLEGALQEAYAISRGTKCKQFMFSVNLSPPETEDVPDSVFEDAASRIEEAMKLSGQPHVMAFHEKEGRRHAHVVWSRIDTEQMKAINLPFFKNRMNEIARSMFLDYGWTLPKGFIDKEMANPLNFTHEEWQQAKRLGEDPRMNKITIQDSWQKTKTKDEFSQLLEKRGFYLARGDRRGFVVVDWRGNTFSLSRMTGEKKKSLQARLGDPEQLPSVEGATQKIDKELVSQVQSLSQHIQNRYDRMLSPMLDKRQRYKQQHKTQRKSLHEEQEQQRKELALAHQARFKKGLMGLWERFIGRHGKIRTQNECESKALIEKLKAERQILVLNQLKERRHLQQLIRNYKKHRDNELVEMRETVLSKLPDDALAKYQTQFEQVEKQNNWNMSLEL